MGLVVSRFSFVALFNATLIGAPLAAVAITQFSKRYISATWGRQQSVNCLQRHRLETCAAVVDIVYRWPGHSSTSLTFLLYSWSLHQKVLKAVEAFVSRVERAS